VQKAWVYLYSNEREKPYMMIFNIYIEGLGLKVSMPFDKINNWQRIWFTHKLLPLAQLKMQATWKSLLKWKRKPWDHQYYEYWLLAERIQQFQYIQQFEPSGKLWYECY